MIWLTKKTPIELRKSQKLHHRKVQRLKNGHGKEIPKIYIYIPIRKTEDYWWPEINIKG